MSVINLFEATLIESAVSTSSLIIETPRGNITSTLSYDENKISSANPQQVVQLSRHSQIGIWDNPQLCCELLKTRYQPVIPSHMHVSYSYAYVWRIKAKINLSSLNLDCLLTPNEPVKDTDIQTGEGLYSICSSFENESVSLGTEDEDYLYQRAKVCEHLPSRYVTEKLLDYGYSELIDSDKNLIQIHFPPPKSEELIQLQFVVAGGKDGTSNWFAVDADPKNILEQAGCK
jgi:hypothetical protein